MRRRYRVGTKEEFEARLAAHPLVRGAQKVSGENMDDFVEGLTAIFDEWLSAIAGHAEYMGNNFRVLVKRARADGFGERFYDQLSLMEHDNDRFFQSVEATVRAFMGFYPDGIRSMPDAYRARSVVGHFLTDDMVRHALVLSRETDLHVRERKIEAIEAGR